MVDELTYRACQMKGGGNPGVGMRLFVEEAIASQMETQRLLNEVLEKCLDRMELMGDVTLAMRSEQNLLMATLDAVLKEARASRIEDDDASDGRSD